MPASQASAGFTAQFQQFMYYAGPITQLLFWIGLVILAFLAWRDFKRLVDYQVWAVTSKYGPVGSSSRPTGQSAGGAKSATGTGSSDESGVSVDEFVE